MRETLERDSGSESVESQPPRLGIVGGGQLAKMTTLAALRLGCDVIVLERDSDGPAAQMATHLLVGDWNEPAWLLELASMADVVSIENEFLDPKALEELEKAGHELLPSTTCLRRVQDKMIQKQILKEAGLSVPDFTAVGSPDELADFGNDHGWPVVLKARRFGYDGKGNATVRSADEVAQAWEALRGDKNPLYVESFCPFEMELATIVTRARNGDVAQYPVVETIQKDHICHVVRAPAQVSSEVSAEVERLGRKAVEAVDGLGSFGIEMFLAADGKVLINELAPRVHNSGHYSIEACTCSQFENHVRAVMGWPLGSTDLVAPAAVMVNLLGAGKGPGAPEGLDKALAISGAHVHVYGKTLSKPGRKMGHITALGSSVVEAEQTAKEAAALIQFGADQ